MLKNGSRGIDVEELQLFLRAFLQGQGLEISIDGIFGNETRSRLETFQRSNNLEVTGVADQATLDKISAITAATAGFESTQFLRIGDRGTLVEAQQERLKAHGFDLVADKIFGPITKAAVEDFQRQQGLTVTGIIGAETMAALAEEPGTTATITNEVEEVVTVTEPDPSSMTAPAPANPELQAIEPPAVETRVEQPPLIVSENTLSIGDKGEAVGELQRKLRALGRNIVVDDDFGPKTKGHVQAFQRMHGLPETGIADASTLERVNAEYERAVQENRVHEPYRLVVRQVGTYLQDRQNYAHDTDVAIVELSIVGADGKPILDPEGNPAVFMARSGGFNKGALPGLINDTDGNPHNGTNAIYPFDLVTGRGSGTGDIDPTSALGEAYEYDRGEGFFQRVISPDQVRGRGLTRDRIHGNGAFGIHADGRTKGGRQANDGSQGCIAIVTEDAERYIATWNAIAPHLRPSALEVVAPGIPLEVIQDMRSLQVSGGSEAIASATQVGLPRTAPETHHGQTYTG